MQQPNLLDSLIGYEPIIDRKRGVMALRVRLQAASGQPQDMSALYSEMSRDWPLHSHTILLSAPQAVLDEQILGASPNPNVWMEVPADLATSAEIQQLLVAMHRKGFPLVLRGRTQQPLPTNLVPAFKMSIIHVNDDRRLHCAEKASPSGVRRSIGYAQDGVSSIELMERCFETGAHAVLGWPMEDAITYRERPVRRPITWPSCS